ncbi:hypothetical protein NAI54_11900, partial [Francisella tularensis subsp. holarctica]|nr:hypothetical protein [Francisella tularensis subsp. holarctica]
MKVGEALTASEKRALAKRTFDNQINNALNINAIKTSFFHGFRVSESFTLAMLNTRQFTGVPLFLLQARLQVI